MIHTKILATTFLSLLLVGSATATEDTASDNVKADGDKIIIISTGGKKYNYYKVGGKLKGLLPDPNKVKVITSKGSKENLDRLMAGEADIGFVQLDALAWFIDKNPDAESTLALRGSLYKECVHLVINPKGKVTDEDHLQTKENVTIGVDVKGSGTAITYDYMLQLEKKYKNAKVENIGGLQALSTLATLGGGLDAMIFVSKPSAKGKLQRTVASNDSLDFIDLDDGNLDSTYKPLGRPIYEFETIEVEDKFIGGTVTVPCVEAGVVTRKDADTGLIESLSDILLNYKSTLLGKS